MVRIEMKTVWRDVLGGWALFLTVLFLCWLVSGCTHNPISGKPLFNSVSKQIVEPTILVLYDDYDKVEVKVAVEAALNEFYAQTGITGRVIEYKWHDWLETNFDKMWTEVWAIDDYWANKPADWIIAVRMMVAGEYIALALLFVHYPGTTMMDETREHKLTCTNTLSQRVLVHELYRLARDIPLSPSDVDRVQVGTTDH